MRVRLKRRRLARRLAESRLSQTAWARRLGVSPSFLSRLLSGRRPYPGPATRRKLLDALQLEFDELFEIVETPAAEPADQVARRGEAVHQPANSRLPRNLQPRYRAEPMPPRRRTMLTALVNDALIGLRMCVRQPAPAAVTLLTVALGVGLTTSMFTLVHGVLLKPLAIDEPAAVMVLTETRDGKPFQGVSAPNFVDWRRSLRSFAHLAAVGGGGTLTLGQPPEPVRGQQVSAGFFEVMGLTPLRGRTLTQEDERAGAAAVAVLSESVWRSAFGEDPEIVGRVIEVAGAAHTVVGIVPDLLLPSMDAGLFVPLNIDSAALNRRGRRTVSVLGRLGSGVAPEQAQVELSTLAGALAEEHPGSNLGWNAALEPITDSIVGDSRRPLSLLFAAVAFLLLIGCVNVAGLGLARAISRTSELSLRTALGAGRGRIVRQLLTENVAITGLGGLAGCALAWLLTGTFLGLVPPSVPRLQEVGPDGTVLAFALLITVAVGLLSGTVPAAAVAGREREAGLGTASTAFTESRRQRSLHQVLVTAELALAVVMLVGAGLFLKTLASLVTHDLGFRTDRAVSFQLRFPADPYDCAEVLRAATDRVVAGFEAVPGVASAAAVSHLPLSGANMTTGFRIQGRERVASGPSAGFRIVTPGYFPAMGISIERGRPFGPVDRAGAPGVVLVNEAAARAYWPGASPVGERISFETRDDEPVWAEIVGVVSDVQHFGPSAEPAAEIYQSYLQADAAWRWVGRFLTFVVHSEARPPGDEQVRALVAAQAPDARLGWVRSLDALLWDNVEQPRFRALLLGAFGASGLLLASVGIYALTAFQLRRRQREIGIRVAIGASRGRVMADVLAQTLRLVAVGSVVGLAGAWTLQGFVRSFLFEVSAADPVVYLAAPVVLGAVVVAATLWPASRATVLDVRQLRTD